MPNTNWLSRLLEMIPVNGRLDYRCFLGPPQRLVAGDIVLLPQGSNHTLHDGSGVTPVPAHNREGSAVVFTENEGTGETLDMRTTSGVSSWIGCRVSALGRVDLACRVDE